MKKTNSNKETQKVTKSKKNNDSCGLNVQIECAPKEIITNSLEDDKIKWEKLGEKKGETKGKIEAAVNLILASQISVDEAIELLKIDIKCKSDIKEALKKCEKETGFSVIRQGTATNMLTKIKPVIGKNTAVNHVNVATVTQGAMVVTIPHFRELANLRTSTYQLLDALTVVLTETGAKNQAVSLPLEDYMEKRGIKDRKEARKQAIEDLNILFNAQISFSEKKGKKQTQDFHEVRIIDSMGIKKGIINASFGSVFYKILLGYPIMPYPSQLWKINGKRNPNSFYLLRKIAEHKNMNVGKVNENIIAVETLLSASPNLPPYNVVTGSDGAINKRIIEPFERDMDTLADTLTWIYCCDRETPLTREQVKGMDYNTFKDLLIKIDWKEYPDQTARLERKAKRIEQAEKTKIGQGKKTKSGKTKKGKESS